VPSRTELDRALLDRVVEAGEAAGLVAVGTTSVGSWTATRARLEAHREAGRGGGMSFTLRNPARSTEAQRLLRHAGTIVVGAWSYAQRVGEAPTGPRGRVARYATADHYGRLRAALDEVAGSLREAGHRAAVYSDDNGLVDREAAWRAGIGWYGRNANLLVPGVGSYVVLGAVVTDAVLPRALPPVGDGCGACTRCVPACPTGAIVAPGVVDARRCLAWVVQSPDPIPVELREAVGDRVYGCDDCQEVCPPNRLEERRRSAEGGLALETEPGPWIDPVAWLDLDDAALLAAADRWYVAGRDADLVRRTLLVVLGNGPATPEAVAAVARHLDHPHPQVGEHARWAAERLSHRACSSG